MSVLPTYAKRPGVLKSLRRFPLAVLLGLVSGGLLIVVAEWREERAEPKAAREVRAREFTGPVVNSMKVTTGGDWLSPTATSQPPLKAEQTQTQPLPGAGYSAARSAAGLPWGPVAEVQNAPLSRSAWGNFNAPLARENYSVARPAYPMAGRTVPSDSGSMKTLAAAPALRFRDQND